MMKHTMVWILFVLALTSWGDWKPEVYRFRRTAVAERGTNAGEFAALPLDALTWRIAHQPGAGLRLADASGREIPFRAVRRVREVERELFSAVPADWTLLPGAESGPPRYLVTIRGGRAVDRVAGIELGGDRDDFLRNVKIESSTDQVSWRVLAADQPFFRESKWGLERQRIVFDAPPARFFRVTLGTYAAPDAVPFLPLRLRETPEAEQNALIARFLRQSVRLEHVAILRKRTEKVEAPIFVSAAAQTRKLSVEGRTVYEITTNGMPVSELFLSTSSLNYARRTVIYGGSEEAEHELGGGVLYRLSSDAFRQAAAELSFTESRFARYRVVIEDDGAPPLEDVTLVLRGPAYALLFPGELPSRVAMYLGGPEAYPEYDIDRQLLALSVASRFNYYHLAPGLDHNPVFVPPVVRVAGTGWLWWFLPAVFGGAAFLAWRTFRARKEGGA